MNKTLRQPNRPSTLRTSSKQTSPPRFDPGAVVHSKPTRPPAPHPEHTHVLAWRRRGGPSRSMGPGYFFSLLQSSGVSAATDFGTHPRLRKTIRRGRTRIYGCWYSVRGVKPNVYQYPRSYMVRCRHLQRLDLLFSPRAGDIAALLSFGAKVWMFRRWSHFRPCNGDASGCYWPRKEIPFEKIGFRGGVDGRGGKAATCISHRHMLSLVLRKTWPPSPEEGTCP